jgi:hypothetical protein
MAGLRQIKNRKASKTEPDTTIVPDPTVIRTTVNELRSHAQQCLRHIDTTRRPSRQNSCEATHISWILASIMQASIEPRVMVNRSSMLDMIAVEAKENT